MPQLCMSDRQFLTASPDKTSSPVSGQMPPLARVAAMTEADSAVTSIEHNCEKGNVTGLVYCIALRITKSCDLLKKKHLLLFTNLASL